MKKIEERVTRLEVKSAEDKIMLKTIRDTIIGMDAKMDGLDHIIRGNGTPGMAAKVDAISTRVVTLEGNRNRWRDVAFTVAGGLLIGVLLNLFQTRRESHDLKSVPQMQQKP